MAALALSLSFLVSYTLAPSAARLLARAGLTAANHRGQPVPQGAGFILPVAHLAGTGVLILAGLLTPARAWPGVAGTFAMGLAGLLDDAAGGGEPKGWLGHGRSLARGQLTAGAFKGLTGLAMASLLGLGVCGWGGAAAVALGANALNTVDTRPGRALLALALGALLLGWVAGPGAGVPVLPLVGAALGLWPAEGREEVMWGDAGANAAGFALGWSWALAGARPAWTFALAAAALVVVGDRVHLGGALPRAGRNERGVAPNPSGRGLR